MSKSAIAALTAAGALLLAGLGFLILRKPSAKLAPATPRPPAAASSSPSLEVAGVQAGERIVTTLLPLVFNGGE